MFYRDSKLREAKVIVSNVTWVISGVGDELNLTRLGDISNHTLANLTRMGQAMNTTIFVTNGPCTAGLGR